MKIALIGASGFVGSAILTEALSRQHSVTALVRNPEKIKVKHPGLTAKKADVLNEEISSILKGHNAVISAYNAGWKNPEIYRDFLKGSESILNAVKKSGVKRFLYVGGAGSLEISPGVQLVDSPDFPSEWRNGALAARDFFLLLKKEKELEWTFLSPAILLEPGERTGKFRIGHDQPVFNSKGESKISVTDLAVAIINELEKPEFIQRRFTMGY
jgi:uncharacterized protein